MSLSVSCIELVEVPLGVPLAQVIEDGDLSLWPGGIGVGPMIAMSLRDWEMLKQSADAAIAGHIDRLKRLNAHTACEGNNGDDD